MCYMEHAERYWLLVRLKSWQFRTKADQLLYMYSQRQTLYSGQLNIYTRAQLFKANDIVS